MSIAALNWAFTRSMSDPAAKAVLVALADHVGEDGRCWPSVARICLMTSLAERTVQLAQKRLMEMDAIRVERRAGRANVIVLNFGWLGQTPAPDAPPQEMHPAPDAPQPPHQMRPTPAPDAPAPAPDAPEPSISTNEPPVEPPTARKADGKSRARKTRLSPDWQPDADDREYARKHGRDPEPAAENFRDYWIGKGEPMADWKRVWQRYCRSTIDRPGQHPGGYRNGRPQGHRPGGGGIVAAVAAVQRAFEGPDPDE